ncbi:MAG: C40 family peptidase [Bifidobacteriaceae bacterium]|jgi:cell wall-associated NlpC family hydrolase|nr:C40 family peptidase [Bifidobacteriaceae bacterium]
MKVRYSVPKVRRRRNEKLHIAKPVTLASKKFVRPKTSATAGKVGHAVKNMQHMMQSIGVGTAAGESQPKHRAESRFAALTKVLPVIAKHRVASVFALFALLMTGFVTGSQNSTVLTASAQLSSINSSLSTTANADWTLSELEVPVSEAGEIEKDKNAVAEVERKAEEERASRQQAQRAELLEQSRAIITNSNLTGDALHSQIAQIGLSQVGAPYVAGGNTPAGWDCSGFVQWVYAQAGRSVPRGPGEQMYAGRQISPDEAVPGDIVAHGGHSGIYVGNGQMVNAMNPSMGTRVWPVDGSYVFVRVE